MNPSEVLKVLTRELGTSEIAEINKILKAHAAKKDVKAAQALKFKIMGEKIGYLGLTVPLKAFTEEGLKIFDIGRVKLIRFEDIESFEKAKPRIPRPVRPKKLVGKPKAKPGLKTTAEKAGKKDEDDFGETFKKSRPTPNFSFIPKKSRR